MSSFVISNHNSYRVLFDKIASVYFIWKTHLHFSIGNSQPREPTLCQLYQRTYVPHAERHSRKQCIKLQADSNPVAECYSHTDWRTNQNHNASDPIYRIGEKILILLLLLLLLLLLHQFNSLFSRKTWRHKIKESASTCQLITCKKVKVARVTSIGFKSWSRFLAVSLQVMRVINPAVGCRYFPPGSQLPSQPLRGLLPILLLGEQRIDRCEQFA